MADLPLTADSPGVVIPVEYFTVNSLNAKQDSRHDVAQPSPKHPRNRWVASVADID
jgi:hypothetical protein